MADGRILTAPDPNETGWPKGVPYIIGNEGCERFSFYGMKAILQVHLTSLFAAQGLLQQTAEENAQHMGHIFMAAVYATPMIGAIVADRLLGKYRTIVWLSLVYCLGHLVLAIAENSIGGMQLGLALIAIGSGGIKPCVSAHVGDQFGKGNWSKVQKVFQAFYFIINFGSFFSTLLIPWLRNNYGADVAFGVPGVLMLIATITFWMGRHVFVHIPPNPGGHLGLLDTISSTMLFLGTIGIPLFFSGSNSAGVTLLACLSCLVFGLWVFAERQALQQDDGFLAVMMHAVGALLSGENRKRIAEVGPDVPQDSLKRHWMFSSAAFRFGEEAAEGPRAVLRIISVFFLVSVFWALFDQHATSWVRQAMQMDRLVFGIQFDASQISALNPLMVMVLIPFNDFVLFPLLEKLGVAMPPLRRMTIGMLVAGFAFAAVALIQTAIETSGKGTVSVLWQIVPYLIMTQAEVMVSITGLEFAYTQAPRRMKSTIMGFWLLTVSFGNVLAAWVTTAQSWLLPKIMKVDPVEGPGLVQFFWFFAFLMMAAGVLFGLRARFYRGREYSQ